MGISRSAPAAAAALLLAAAWGFSSPGGGPGSCADVSGSWTLSGNCADDACTVTQKDCNITLSCPASGGVCQGTVSGTSISFGGGSISFSANVGNKTSSGSCNSPSAGTCQFTGSCSSGACGGGTGSNGGSGLDCYSACGSVTQCCSA